MLARILGNRLSAVFVREERPSPSRRVRELAEWNVEELRRIVPASKFEPVTILDVDNAVVGGRNAVEAVRRHSFSSVTDILVDMSAMSIGTSFPIVRYLLELVERGEQSPNLHVVVATLPEEDEGRRRVSNDVVSIVHGFHGGLKLDSQARSAKLWIPQLSVPKLTALEKIYAALSFDDVCPILPFPSQNPRAGDAIAEQFIEQIEGAWEVDARNIVYASEDDPIDVYRTILDIEEQRRPVFEETIKSVVVLSPVGTKAVALGSLLAALDRGLPVVYVEAMKYDVPTKEDRVKAESELLHVWLHGDAYPRAGS
ncbi:hypothetical protein AB3662_06990 [Sorangium cellulosum]|uniref:hypothetical protein n=1 Tax=Sorangium cellulosum TaxID=56 RepID=UPI003D9A9DEA